MRQSLSYLIFLLMVACGGGGGSSPSSPDQGSTSTPSAAPSPTPTPTPTPSSSITCDDFCFQAKKDEYEDLYEYSRQDGLGMSNASSAYARGATGEGMIIGVVDSGLDSTHAELSSRVHAGSQLNYSNYIPTTAQKRHGTAVSSIIVGNRSDDDSPMHGVAFDAKVFFLAVQLGTAPEVYTPVDLGDSSGEGSDTSGVDDFYEQVFNIFINNEVDVVNNSFGYTGVITEYTEEQLRSNFSKTIEKISQINVLDQDKTLFVWSAGNSGMYADQGADYSSPNVFPGMPYYLTELKGHSLAVVSVDSSTGVIADSSNRCGIAKDFCLAAPGDNVVIAHSTTSTDTGLYESTDSCILDNSCYALGSGTSYAAPFVSGGLALLTQFFGNQLGNVEILQRILSTANKTGIYSEESIYGQGLMDLDAATKPVGSTMIATAGLNLSNLFFTEEGSYLGIIGPAFGDSAPKHLSQLSYVVFDQLGAPFKRSFSQRLLNNIPNIRWLTNFQNSQNRQLNQHSILTSDGGKILLGINHNLSFIPDSSRLWADTRNILEYFSIERNLNERSKLFFGKGTSLNILLSSDSGISHKGIPFLDFSSDGSFIGMDISLSPKRSFLFSLFQGTHDLSKRFVKPLKDSEGFIMEIIDNFKGSKISYHLGVTKDNSNMLTISSMGGFGQPGSASTSFLGIEILTRRDDFNFRSSLNLGKSKSDFNQTGIINGIDDTYFSSFDFGLYKENIFTKNDSLGLQIYQPLRSEYARVDLSIPTGRTKNKKILFKDLSLDLSPAGRQINSQLVYSTIKNNFTFLGRLGLISNEFHQKDGKVKAYFQIDLKLSLE